MITTSSILLEVRDLVCGYGKLEVLHRISLQVRENEIVSLIGHNGAGKTTLLRAVFGLQKVNSGSVLFMGEDITNTPSSKNVLSGISYVPQSNNIFSGFSVLENLKLATHVLGKKTDPAELYERIEDVYRLFPILRERGNQYAGKLSGGQKQMLAIGMALMHRPKLLLLDEPSIGLAPVLFEQVLDSIVEVNKKFGTSVILVEQNVKKALNVSQCAFVLKLGKVQSSFNTANAELDNLWAMF